MELFKTFNVGKYLLAKVSKVLPKTVIMTILNKHYGDHLGEVRWFPKWRQYCFKIGDKWFSASCLRDIADFLDRSNSLHKGLRKNEKKTVRPHNKQG